MILSCVCLSVEKGVTESLNSISLAVLLENLSWSLILLKMSILDFTYTVQCAFKLRCLLGAVCRFVLDFML